MVEVGAWRRFAWSPDEEQTERRVSEKQKLSKGGTTGEKLAPRVKGEGEAGA
jgi:hypothetical protein